MDKIKSDLFLAKIEIIGINPFVYLPDTILNSLFVQANKSKGHIPIKGTINDNPYKQTLVKYSGEWRLYINTTMLKNSPKRIGETIEITVEYDPTERVIAQHPKFIDALNNNQKAKNIFDNLRPSLQLEIVRYISRLKSEESIDNNVVKAIDFLLGKGRFVGREKP
jgi:Domain of unknown function (DUF1905)